jgi:hypothetical protein
VPENWGDVSQRLFPEDCSLTLNCSRTASILLATRYPLDERHFLSVETVRMYCRYLLLVFVQRAFHAHRADSGTPGPVARHAQSSRPFVASLMPFWVVKLVLFGSEVFTPWTPVLDSSLWLLLLIVLFYLVDLVIGGWYLVTLSRSVAEVYECSAWLAFALILLSSVVFSVVLSFVLLFFV